MSHRPTYRDIKWGHIVTVKRVDGDATTLVYPSGTTLLVSRQQLADEFEATR